MTDVTYSFLFNEINDLSQRTVLAEESIILTEVEPEKVIRRLPFYENRFIVPTTNLPTLAGLHISQKMNFRVL